LSIEKYDASCFIGEQSGSLTVYGYVRYLQYMSESSSPSILVAEDDSLIRDVYVEMLKNAGYDVDEAVDGKQTLEK